MSELNLNTLADFITARIDESVGGICNIEDDLPADELKRNNLQKTITDAIADFRKKANTNATGTKKAREMQDRANALADILVDAFGYTDSQLVAHLTISAIVKRLIDDKLDGKYEPASKDNPGVYEDIEMPELNAKPIENTFNPCKNNENR